jgi:hypothetical protein
MCRAQGLLEEGSDGRIFSRSPPTINCLDRLEKAEAPGAGLPPDASLRAFSAVLSMTLSDWRRLRAHEVLAGL